MQKTTFAEAIEAHQSGKLERAEGLYRRLLAMDPGDINAMHMLAVVYYQKDEYDRALEYFNKILAKGVTDAGVYNNLGNVYMAKGQLERAMQSFVRSTQIDSRFFLAYHNIGNIHRTLSHPEKAYAAYRNAISINPEYSDGILNLACTCVSLDKTDEAAEYFNTVLRLNPSNETARHMMAGLLGERTDQPPRKHVSSLFDYYSSSFDSHLVKELGYDVPKKVAKDLRAHFPFLRFKCGLDLGCGTGLVGVEITDLVDKLTGVDLSPKMVEKARQRNIYCHLHAGDVKEYLAEQSEKYDLIVCADVFPYIGSLDELFEQISLHLHDGAVFIFSTEKSDTYPFKLLPTGRYAHAENYIDESMRSHSLEAFAIEIVNIRKHKGRWIEGNYIIARKLSSIGEYGLSQDPQK